MGFNKVFKNLSRQKINDNRRLYIPAELKNIGFEIGKEVEVLAVKEN